MQNLTKFLEFHSKVRPNSAALVYENHAISYRELYKRALSMAGWLQEQSIDADTVVALLMKNSPAFLEIVFALSHIGAVVLPLNYRLAAAEIAYITDHAGAVMLMCDDEFIDKSSDLEAPVVCLDAAMQRDSMVLSAGTNDAPSMHGRAGSDLFRLMYTSGTTDRPKGVVHSYANLYWKNIDHVIALQLRAEDRIGVVGPLYHVGAFDLPGISTLWVGGTMVLLREFDAVEVMRMIAAQRVAGIWLPPAMSNAILSLEDPGQYDASSLKWCIGGGERTPESRIRSFVETFPNARYIDAYGMTETLSGDTMMQAGYELEKIGSTGRVLSFGELEIRDDTGVRVATGKEGEICMRGDKITSGYWRDPERTKQAFWPDGWLRSGDAGYLDEDGFLFLTDRRTDLIISGGENIASSEVERVLYEVPAVLEAAVVAKPDQRWGETPVAFVVTKPGQVLDLADLQAHCRDALAPFKIPKELVEIDALPRNPSGKVLKRLLRDQLAASIVEPSKNG